MQLALAKWRLKIVEIEIVNKQVISLNIDIVFDSKNRKKDRTRVFFVKLETKMYFLMDLRQFLFEETMEA